MWFGALSAVPQPRSPFAPDVQMTAQQTDEVLAAIADALLDAELTVDELTTAIVERTGSWAGDPVMPAFQGMWPRWRQALSLAGARGVLCFGPNRGRVVTYTSPRRWLPDTTWTTAAGARRPAAPVPVRLRTRDPAALRALAERLTHLGNRALRVGRRRARAGRGRGHGRLAARRRGGRRPRRRGCPAAAVLRRVRRRRPATFAALPATGLGPCPRPRPGRQLPGPAGRRHGRRRVAPPARRPEGRRDGRAAGPADRRPAPRAGAAGRTGRRDPGGDRGAHRGTGVGRPARLTASRAARSRQLR